VQQNAGSCLLTQSVSLRLFIGELSPLILRDIKERLLLVPVMFVLVGDFMWISAFGFLVRSLISCPFLVVEFSF
jgi:hypothetical protein